MMLSGAINQRQIYRVEICYQEQVRGHDVVATWSMSLEGTCTFGRLMSFCIGRIANDAHKRSHQTIEITLLGSKSIGLDAGLKGRSGPSPSRAHIQR